MKFMRQHLSAAITTETHSHIESELEDLLRWRDLLDRKIQALHNRHVEVLIESHAKEDDAG